MNKNTLYLWAALMAAFNITNASTTTAACNTDCAQSQNLWQPHAFSAYSSRDLMMKKNMYETESSRDEWFGTFSTASEYMQGFGQKCGSCKNLGALPFWSGTNSMTYGTNDGKSDLDAYQMGMGNIVGQGTITLTPKVVHVGTDLMLHFAHKKDERGFFFTVKAPVGALSVTTQLSEVVAPNTAGFFGTDLTATANVTGTTYNNPADNNVDTAWLSYPSPGNRYNSLADAFQGGSADSVATGALSSSLHKPLALEKGRISECKLTAIRIGDVSTTVGYTVWANENGFVDLGFKASMPTGNVPQAKYVLEPIFGRAGHWGVGAELTGHYKAWENEKGTSSLDLWLEGEVMHLISGRTPNWRSFDLKLNGKGSKYMLLQFYYPGSPLVASTTPTITTNVNLLGTTPSFVTHAINVTTMPVKSTIAAEGSVALMADFHHNNWNAALGGEFWGRSNESLKIDTSNLVRENIANLNEFAVLGRQISEDARNIATATVTSQILNLYLCEPAATISKSQQTVLASSTGTFHTAAPSTYPATLPAGIKDARYATNRIPAALDDALDIAGAAAARAFTGKIFGQLGYTWNDCRYTPNVAFFGSAEFAPANNNTAINLWAVGVQGAINF